MLFHVVALLVFSAIRISELVASSKHGKSDRALRWGDVTIHDQQLVVTVGDTRQTKLVKVSGWSWIAVRK